MFKKYLSTILWYIGVGFISGAVSHGFFTWTRSLLMAGLWIILFVIHQYLDDNQKKDYKEIIVYGLLFSLAVGMVSWGLQHFLDSPTRSIWIIPVWFVLSYVIYGLHVKNTNWQKNSIIALGWGFILFALSIAAYYMLPQSLYSPLSWHHGEENINDHACVGNECKKDMSHMNWMGWHEDMAHTSDGTHHNHSVESEEMFLIDMIPHHQEAIDSAKIMLARSENADVKKLAENIIRTQSEEITMMTQWLKTRYPTTTKKSTYTPMMSNLNLVSWKALDELFLKDMILHHEWAVKMAQSVLALPHRVETMNLANGIIKAQNEEIKLMNSLLENSQ